ncbi:hypothetical protein HNQ77_005330 [Silvibacterium bohemicum]|uniref:Uncharacterized protein n=1 Tax=Silvibacterium bohemicum TaxID=1577686 RepID=A0A841KAJ9_9BACT|nr:hypothetical protein [Silvibacterium bohemicum]MBB6147334.1 hypothetical protein [Silvibacterium bohemicum]
MHTDDSPIERTPDLVAKIRALREQAEKDMDRFTNAGDYDVRRVTGRKPKLEIDVLPPDAGKKKRGKKTEQASIDFSLTASQDSAADGDES